MKRRLGISCWLVLFISLGLMMVPAGWAAQKIFVCIPAIPGESTDVGHRDCIDATSYSDGVFNTGNILGGAGASTGKVAFNPIQITKSLDKASPILRLAAAMGKRLNNVTVDIVKPGELPFIAARISLNNALVTEVSMTVNLVDPPKEVVTFDFVRITLTYFQQNEDGSQGEPVTFSWDRQRNIPF